jgi:hypothetical protein
MNRVIRRTWLSALVLAAMAVFAGCAAETGDPEESAAGQEQAGSTPKDGDGEGVGTAKQADISLIALDGAKCIDWGWITVGGAQVVCCNDWYTGKPTCSTNPTCADAKYCAANPDACE